MEAWEVLLPLEKSRTKRFENDYTFTKYFVFKKDRISSRFLLQIDNVTVLLSRNKNENTKGNQLLMRKTLHALLKKCHFQLLIQQQ